MAKHLTFKTEDGATWAVPAEVIAHDRATHYAEDGYKEEFEFTMSDDSELIDWAANNMNFSEVEAQVFLFKPAPSQDMQEAWVNGEKGVIEFERNKTPEQK
jgi:hypothetical protein